VRFFRCVELSLLLFLALISTWTGKAEFLLARSFLQDNEKIDNEIEKTKKKKHPWSEVQKFFDEGLKLAQEGKHVEAIVEFRKALSIDQNQANILGYMAESYSRLNKNNEALEIYKKAIALKPDNAAFYTNMGVILSKMEKDSESEEAFRKAAEINPASAAQNWYNIGAIQLNNGRMPEAAEYFRKSIAADPNFGESYYHLGISLSHNPETASEALNALRKYIQIGIKQEQVEIAKQVIATLEQSLRKK
jgi:tetratricopeptide (TPR) repeat protein